MVIFEHTSSDKVILGERTLIELTIYEEVIEDTYVINIPSLNMHMHTKKKDEIDKLIHNTLTSFFKFWKNIQGMPKLYEHMLALGFSIRNDEILQTLHGKETGKKIKEELESI